MSPDPFAGEVNTILLQSSEEEEQEEEKSRIRPLQIFSVETVSCNRHIILSRV
jgi:hypothetical protein